MNHKVGIFSFKGSNAKPAKNVNWNCLDFHQVHVHPQKGGMCFSPNNGKIIIEKNQIACVWSVININNR